LAVAKREVSDVFSSGGKLKGKAEEMVRETKQPRNHKRYRHIAVEAKKRFSSRLFHFSSSN